MTTRALFACRDELVTFRLTGERHTTGLSQEILQRIISFWDNLS